jgi:hypothetical protein
MMVCRYLYLPLLLSTITTLKVPERFFFLHKTYNKDTETEIVTLKTHHTHHTKIINDKVGAEGQIGITFKVNVLFLKILLGLMQKKSYIYGSFVKLNFN